MTAGLAFFVMTILIGIPFVVLTWISNALEDSYRGEK